MKFISQFETLILPNLGVLRGDLSQNIIDSLMEEIDDIQKNGGCPQNKNLAAFIEEEYLIEKSILTLAPYLETMVQEYRQVYKCHLEENEFSLSKVWVNLQKKNEINILHNHDGNLSFVIWLKIPYKLDDEMNMKNVINARGKEASSNFALVYSDILGEINNFNLPVDEDWEGKIILFPSRLQHMVYPFQTSDDYRISVSGNIYFKL